MKPLLLDTFSIPTFPSSTEFDSVRSNNFNNLMDRAQIMEAQGDLALGLSIMVLSTQSGGAGGKIAGMYCTFQFFNFSFLRISLFRASDQCVNSAPSTVAQHSHIFSRVLGLKEQH